MSGLITNILWIVYIVGFEILYHKIFRVTYFGGGAIVKEILICAVIALALAQFTVSIWWIILPIMIIVVLMVLGKKNDKKE